LNKENFPEVERTVLNNVRIRTNSNYAILFRDLQWYVYRTH